jgi:c-di-GMP-related signal transduction protein
MPAIAPFVERATALPAMPEVSHKLLQSFDRDDLSLTELAALVGRDQALSAKVLRLANSARYSPARSVASLPDAAAALGLRTLRGPFLRFRALIARLFGAGPWPSQPMHNPSLAGWMPTRTPLTWVA